MNAQSLMLSCWIAAALSCTASRAMADNYDNEWENVSQKKKSDQEERSNGDNKALEQAQSEEADKMEEAGSKQVRRFHEVLDELLAEFGYDVRMGQLNGLKNLSIRRVDVSDALPSTYRTYVEMLVAERIRENSRVRLISCIPCRTKTSYLSEGRLMITSPTTNVDRMKEAAQQLGIDQFMDVILVYHTTHMVLALQVFNATTQEMVWTRTYNSETIKTRFQKLAVDYQQVEKARPGEEYTPEYRTLIGVGGGIIPNVNPSSDYNGVVALLFRGTEKFDNRKHEFGLHSNIYLRRSALFGGSAADEDKDDNDGKTTDDEIKPWNYAFTLYGMYSRHFVGNLESYNEIRHSANAGVGFLASSTFLTSSVRVGWDMYFGKRFATNFGLVYLAPSVMTVDNQSVKIKGGIGGDLTISINY